ncbi:hypothetical protein J5Y03_14695 [Bacillus sp. RG28]|uniref:Uncharacterized protein n=1 Tax=Gottfriedia endophytica TaxID=2820819 RepID=A0A940SHP9_9BACI|nr:hypothetical protein [Gottfriedia endophytica]MBP0726407.1 hypothetical protein [Gottfriedia endophytica]
MIRPIGVNLISCFYIFGSIILLLSALFYDPTTADEISIATRIGLSNAYVPEQLVRVLVALFSLVLIYGYIRLKKWGFWLMIGYSLIFGLISFTLAISHKQQPFIGNTIWSIIVLLYTRYAYKYFDQNKAIETHI